MHRERTDTALRRELLLLGGGHAHLSVIRAFGMRPVHGVRITVVSRDVHTPYSGMLPGLVAGHYTLDQCHVDLRRLCQANGVALIHGEVTGIDRENARLLFSDRPSLPYDLLSLNTGSRPALDSITGAQQHGIAVKPVDRFLQAWQEIEDGLTAHTGPHRIVVVGGGAAGVEIALACEYRLRQRPGPARSNATILLLDAATELLGAHNARVRACFARLLQRRGIEVRLHSQVIEATPDGVQLADAGGIEAETVIWAIHAGAPRWPRDAGLDCDTRGFVRVDDCLRSLNDPRIFAAGDIASLPRPVAKSGVYAVREGPLLARNLRAVLNGGKPEPYRPQRRVLSLLSCGDRHAVASRGALFLHGAWVWRWKDRIDRSFMARFDAEPLPPAATGEEITQMPCGGCAAKLGAPALQRVLAGLGEAASEDVNAALASAEDAAVITIPPGKRLVQSVDYFPAFIDDPYLLGRIAALHCLGDLAAMGAKPHSALAIASVAHASPHIMERTLSQLMQGAKASLDAHGVALAGGHSSAGTETAFGLSVNGFADETQLLYKSGLRAGDALILCKALGHGTLLAANMRAACAARDFEAAVANMLLAPFAALSILREHGVRACTDVTGFGLLGHLLEMLRASGLGARLDAAAIPALPGALRCLQHGYRSSLHRDNAVFLDDLDTPGQVSPVLRDLLVDPQTAGGLLGGVPAESAEDCVRALHEAGYVDANCIGSIDQALPAERVLLS